MTRNDDIERVLELWLDEGPRHMSDRLFDGTFDRIDRLPRGRLADLQSRLPTMSVPFRLAIAVGVLIAIGGGGLIAMHRGPNVTADPSATPFSSPGPTVLHGSFPSASDLRGHWTATTPRLVNNGPETATWEIVVDPVSFEVGRTGHTMTGPWFINEAGTLSIALWTQPANWGCRGGDQGLYEVRLSGDILTVALRSDQCAVRPAMFAGDWARTPPGQLASARRTLTQFRPFGAGTAGSMSTTIPALLTTGESEAGVMFTNPFSASGLARGIQIDSSVELLGQSAGCADDIVGVGRTPAAIVDWLATVSSLVVTAPVSVDFGGLNGLMIDVSTDPAAGAPCGTIVSPFDIAFLKVMPDSSFRWIFLDRGDGQSISIRLDTPGTTLDVDDGPMAIVNDFQFTR